MNNKLSNEEINIYKKFLDDSKCSRTHLTSPREIIVLDKALTELLARREAESEPVGSFHIFNGKVEGTTDFIADGKWPIDYGELVVYASPVLGQTPESINAELLHALRELACVARRYLPDYDEHPEIQQADNAIAKATGESE